MIQYLLDMVYAKNLDLRTEHANANPPTTFCKYTGLSQRRPVPILTSTRQACDKAVVQELRCKVIRPLQRSLPRGTTRTADTVTGKVVHFADDLFKWFRSVKPSVLGSSVHKECRVLYTDSNIINLDDTQQTMLKIFDKVVAQRAGRFPTRAHKEHMEKRARLLGLEDSS